MANGSTESGIAKWINIKTILTGVVFTCLAFTAGSVLLARDNAKDIENIEAEQCEAKVERKDIVKDQRLMREDIQELVVALTNLTGELKVTNERTKQTNDRIEDLADKIK